MKNRYEKEPLIVLVMPLNRSYPAKFLLGNGLNRGLAHFNVTLYSGR